MARVVSSFDGIKNLGYHMAYVAGLSFNLDDHRSCREERHGCGAVRMRLTSEANLRKWVSSLIHAYNQVQLTWTHVNNLRVTKHMTEADCGIQRCIYMMPTLVPVVLLTRLLQPLVCGLMAASQKAGAEGAQIIENPIISTLRRVCQC